MGTPTRYAIVTGARSRREAAAYLPENYAVADELSDGAFVISGQDFAGWDLDTYVIPRYASGLIRCEEVTLAELEGTQASAASDEGWDDSTGSTERQRAMLEGGPFEVRPAW